MKSRILEILRKHELDIDSAAIFLSSAYSHECPVEMEFRVLAVTKIAALIRDAGACCYSPIIHWHPVHKILPADYNCYITNDLIMLRKHDILFIALTPGLENSTGVALEYQLAKTLNIPIYYIDLIGAIHDGNDPDSPFTAYIKQP